MLAVLVAILLMSFVYPMFSNFDYNDVSKVNDFTARLNPPSAKAFFGTDNMVNPCLMESGLVPAIRLSSPLLLP